MTGPRQEQGRMARMAAFWICTLLLLFGCTSLHTTLVARDLLTGQVFGVERIPVLGIDFNWAFVVASVLFLAGASVIAWWQAKPKVSGLLNDTEAELRKVAWPTFDEVVRSSVVVIVCVVVLGVFLAGSDMVLGRVAQMVLTLGG